MDDDTQSMRFENCLPTEEPPRPPPQPQPPPPLSQLRTQSQDSTTIYYVYHIRPKEHILITSKQRPKKQKKKKKKNKNKNENHIGQEEYEQPSTTVPERSYFVHRPQVSCQSAPRTIHRGSSKKEDPICILHNSLFWRRWKLQFGAGLKDVLDPRGVVGWDYRTNPDNRVRDDGYALKGYKVPKRRMWGNSGKEYHRQVNAKRKEEKQQQKRVADNDNENNRSQKSPDWDLEFTNTMVDPAKMVVTPEKVLAPEKVLDEVLYLDWVSPLSKKTRCYHFRYAGIDFYWKGTKGKSHPPQKSILPFTNLKLVAQVSPPGPLHGVTKLDSGADGEELKNADEIILAKYTSTMEKKEYGRLYVLDDVVLDFMRLYTAEAAFFNDIPDYALFGQKGQSDNAETDDLTRTRFYDVIMSTAVCMIFGEWQKRQTIVQILQAIGGAAGAA